MAPAVSMAELTSSASGVEPSVPGCLAVDDKAVLHKVSCRILPVLFLLALLAYLDRANLSFSASELELDTSIGDFEYGIGGSIFFVGYVAFQLPGTMAARKVGAPAWLTIIMTLWGIVAAGFAALCCQRSGDVTIFYILRFLLGALEAGAFPTMYYCDGRAVVEPAGHVSGATTSHSRGPHCSRVADLTLWYAPDEITIAYPRVTLATAVAGVLGGLLAAAFLSMDGALGLRGWQWVFLGEGVPTVAIALLTPWLLPKTPRHAAFLSAAEQQWFIARRHSAEGVVATGCSLAARDGARIARVDETGNGAGNEAAAPSVRSPAVRALRDGRTWYFGAIWALTNVQYYGIMFWMPQLLRQINPSASPAAVALLTAIPYSCASAVMLGNAANARRTGDRRLHVALPLLLGGFALISAPHAAGSPALALSLLSVATSGTWSVYGARRHDSRRYLAAIPTPLPENPNGRNGRDRHVTGV